MSDRARELFDDAIEREMGERNTNYAARIAKEAGMSDRARELFEKDSGKREKKKDFYGAANSAEEAGMPDRARELFEKYALTQPRSIAKDCHFDNKKILERVEKLAVKTGIEKERLYREIIGAYTKRWANIPGAGYKTAAEFAEEAGMPAERIRDLNLHAIEGFARNSYADAIRLAEEAGLIKLLGEGVKENLLRNIKEERDSEETAELAEKLGMPDRARDYYNKAMQESEADGRFENAAKLAEKLGMPDRARDYRELKKLVGTDFLF